MRLAIAFGSRGKGNALAHYEPSRAVINLTKMKGAGSLAHEFGHALDDMLGQRLGLYGADTMLSSNISHRMYGKDEEVANAMKKVVSAMCKSPFTEEDVIERSKNVIYSTESVLEHYINRIISSICEKDESPETEERLELLKQRIMHMDVDAIDAIMREQEIAFGARVVIQESSIREAVERIREHKKRLYNAELYIREYEGKTKPSNYYTWAKKLDQGRRKKYYSDMAEMFARAFESYVEDTLYEKGIISQYLVHSTRTNSAYGEIKPYPEGKERENINNAIRELMNVVYDRYKDEFGPMTNYDFYGNEDDFVSYQDSIVVVKEPKKTRVTKKTDSKKADRGVELTGNLKEFREALLEIAGNNTKRDNSITDDICMAYMSRLSAVGKQKMGYKAIGFQDLKSISVSGMGNSKSYFTDGTTIRVDSNKPREKQLEGLIECMVYRMVTSRYGSTNAAYMIAEGTTYIILKALGLDVRTYCLSEKFEELAGDINQSKTFIKLCKENYLAFQTLIKK